MNLHVCRVSILFSIESLFHISSRVLKREREREFEFKDIIKIQGSKRRG